MTPPRLAIVVTHPIQYQVPLYRRLKERGSVEPIVLYLTDHGLTPSFDVGFGRTIQYDVPLLGGYDHMFLRNWSPTEALAARAGAITPEVLWKIRRSEIDAVLVHGYSYLSAWFAFGTAALKRIPFLLRGEARPSTSRGRPFRPGAKRMVLGPLVRSAGACLAIGQENRSFYLSYGADPARIFFSPYSVDTERFSREGAIGRKGRTKRLREIGLRPELPLVLFAAKLQAWKRPLDVIRAVESAKSDVNLVIVGDGPLRSEVEGAVAKAGRARAIGFVNQEEIARWYGAADIFVLPSDREPWGVAVNEAMAAGAVPIVSDAVGCAPDLVTEDTGWIYRTGDVLGLAGVIDAACKAGALTARRVAAQRRSSEYGLDATAEGIEHAVASLQLRGRG